MPCILYHVATSKASLSQSPDLIAFSKIFAEIFLNYAKDKKGDIALGILTDKSLMNEDGSSKLVVPRYIQEGLKWLLK